MDVNTLVKRAIALRNALPATPTAGGIKDNDDEFTDTDSGKTYRTQSLPGGHKGFVGQRPLKYDPRYDNYASSESLGHGPGLVGEKAHRDASDRDHWVMPPATVENDDLVQKRWRELVPEGQRGLYPHMDIGRIAKQDAKITAGNRAARESALKDYSGQVQRKFRDYHADPTQSNPGIFDRFFNRAERDLSGQGPLAAAGPNAPDRVGGAMTDLGRAAVDWNPGLAGLNWVTRGMAGREKVQNLPRPFVSPTPAPLPPMPSEPTVAPGTPTTMEGWAKQKPVAPPAAEPAPDYSKLGPAVPGPAPRSDAMKKISQAHPVLLKRALKDPPLGPYTADRAADVVAGDRMTGAIEKNIKRYPMHTTFNPFVRGPVSHALWGLKKRWAASQGAGGPVERYGGALLGTPPHGGDVNLFDLYSMYQGGDDKQEKLRKGMDQSGIMKRYGENSPLPSKPAGPFAAASDETVHALDPIISAAARNRKEHPLNYWLNPFVRGPASEGWWRMRRGLARSFSTPAYDKKKEKKSPKRDKESAAGPLGQLLQKSAHTSAGTRRFP